MKTNSRLRYFLYLSILFVGCTTGKKALQNGDYDASVRKSVDRLKHSPKNKEALEVLTVAYGQAVQSHLRKIEEAERSDDLFKWEYVLEHYQTLDELANEVNSCSTCSTAVPSPRQYSAEITDSRYKAAAVRYENGIHYLALQNREAAKKAYGEFERTRQLIPDFKDVKEKQSAAYQAALVKVVVEPVNVQNNRYELNSLYFQQQVNAFINGYQRNKFVQFYSEAQARNNQVVPDQVISLYFDDFIVGETYVKEKLEKMKRDSVIVGHTRNNKPIYATVKASYSQFNKQVSSSGRLSMVISDYQANKVIKQQRLAGSYVWQDSWANYKGDERALTKQQMKMSGKRELLPPSPNVMFNELTKPIYAQLVDEVNYFYSRY